MSLINSDVIPASATAYEIEQSLRFNDDDSPSLTWTPSSAGNRKTWTWSGWFKRGNVNSSATRGQLFSVYSDGSNYTFIAFDDGGGGYDRIRAYSLSGGSVQYDLESNAQYRDVSGWYHLVVSIDTTQGTSSNRVKVYINGEQVTAWSSSTYPSQNVDTFVNATYSHRLSQMNNASYFDGYLAEVNFIDGQALAATDFGETKKDVWVPKAYSGSYGTNGFYLPFKQDYQVEGFSTVTWDGNGASSRYIGGVGFQPDFIWAKARSRTGNHYLMDAVRGSGTGTLKVLNSDDRIGEQTNTSGGSTSFGVYTSFDTDGFTVANGSSSNVNVNNSGDSYVAWCWDMGGSSVSNTNGSVTSTVRANPTYGQSIVSFTGTGSVLTVGHGLSQAPEVIIVKNRDITSNTPNDGNWRSYFKYLTPSSPENYKINLNDNSSATSGIANWNNTAPTSTVFTVGTEWELNQNGQKAIAYCFHSVTGYSKFGSYMGTGSAGSPTITTGFKPAWVMIKRTDTSGYNWHIYDNTRSPYGNLDNVLYPNISGAEEDGNDLISITDTSFTIQVADRSTNTSGGAYIYMAFADKREYAYWLDQSGNDNNFTSNNLTESDISVDSPTNNFATLNPLSVPNSPSRTFSESNLKFTATTDNAKALGTILLPTSGKWYWEALQLGGTIYADIGVADAAQNNETTGRISYRNDGQKRDETGSRTSYGASYQSGDIIGVAFDADADTLTFYKNNTSQGTAFTGMSGRSDNGLVPFVQAYTTTPFAFNFGQDSSFASNKAPQGNQDSNGIGDFYYTPPTGYLALCNENLPEDDTFELLKGEQPSDHFNTVLYTGNDLASQSITGVGFQPDFTWIKERDSTSHHFLMDAVRGATKFLQSSTTNAEVDNSDVLQSFDSDGFTVGTSGGTNANNTYVAWNWKAGGTPVSNTDGSITSSVSANTTAGFSIVSFTSNNQADTIGHGLSSAPDMIILKNRDSAYNWSVYHSSQGNTGRGVLNNTDSWYDFSGFWNNTTPTSTVFSIGSHIEFGGSTGNMIAYCWHSVPGFSKFGSYQGNSSTNGPFVYTGFRPAFVMVKSTTSTHDWVMEDNTRSNYNPADEYVIANDSQVESSNTYNMTDFLSNGFKLRDTQNGMNGTNTYIYIAFAENPFKYTNAR